MTKEALVLLLLFLLTNTVIVLVSVCVGYKLADKPERFEDYDEEDFDCPSFFGNEAKEEKVIHEEQERELTTREKAEAAAEAEKVNSFYD